MKLPEYSEHEIVVQPLSEVADGEIAGAVGVVKARGIQIKDVSLTDYVLYGSCQPQKLSNIVHEMDYIPIPMKLIDKMAGLIFHGAVILNAFYEAQLHFGENIIVIGEGYRTQLVAKLSEIFGVYFYSTRTLKSMSEQNMDALFISSKNFKNQEFKKSLELLQPRGRLISLAQCTFEKYWDILFQKNIRILLTFAAGAALNQNNKNRCQIPEEYVSGTVKRNLTTFRDWLIAGKVTLDNLETSGLNIKDYEPNKF